LSSIALVNSGRLVSTSFQRLHSLHGQPLDKPGVQGVFEHATQPDHVKVDRPVADLGVAILVHFLASCLDERVDINPL
jgi:hypothetical protein